jgi:quinol monooxygenase YgiN
MAMWVQESNCFLSRFPVEPARRGDFLAALDELLAFAGSIYDEHCNFAFQGWSRDPNEWVAIASWKSEDILAWLRTTPEFQRAQARMLECCNGPMIMENFNGMKMDRSAYDLYPAGSSTVHMKSGDLDVIWR